MHQLQDQNLENIYYHISHDDFHRVVTPIGLWVAMNSILSIDAIQNNYYPKYKILCEPKLSKYNLYNPLRKNKYYKYSHKSTITDPIINILSYADGKNSLLDISDKIKLPIWSLIDICDELYKKH